MFFRIVSALASALAVAVVAVCSTLAALVTLASALAVSVAVVAVSVAVVAMLAALVVAVSVTLASALAMLAALVTLAALETMRKQSRIDILEKQKRPARINPRWPLMAVSLFYFSSVQRIVAASYWQR